MKMGCVNSFLESKAQYKIVCLVSSSQWSTNAILTTKGSFMGIASLETTNSENDLKFFDKGSIKHCVSIDIVVVIFWKCLMD